MDYGEFKNHRRDEAVIFSMQTFVVKLASGVSAFLAAACISVFGISSDTSETVTETVSGAGSLMGLRITMTILPIAGLLIAVYVFKKKYELTEDRLKEISKELMLKNHYMQ